MPNEARKSTMEPAGRFITFEGIDGAGKSSHIEALASVFRHQGHTVTVTREPGGTPLAEKIRALLLNDAMDALTESLLVFAGRRDHLRCVIEPALAKGEVVLSRSLHRRHLCLSRQWTRLRYQIAINIGADGPIWYCAGCKKMRDPDLTLWFDLAPGVAAARLADARAPDRFESQPAEFFSRVRQGYAERASAATHRFVRLDAGKARGAVWSQLIGSLVQRGWLPATAADIAADAP